MMPDSSDFYFANTNHLTNAVVTNNWWVSGGSEYPAFYQITLDKGLFFTNGQYAILHEEGMINMWRPQAAVTTSAGTVALDTDDYVNLDTGEHVFGIHDGIPTPYGTPGITFSNYATWPSQFSGALQWIQVVAASLKRFQTNDGSGDWYRFQHETLLDTIYSDNPGEDSPGTSVDCLDDLGRFKAKNFSLSESFDTWLEFQPSGGQWVPLGKVHWSCGAGASFSGTNCDQSKWTLTDPSNPVTPYSETQQYPYWTNRADNFLHPPDYKKE